MKSATLLIRPGERSGKVADVQTRLRALGLEIDDEPGHFGASTTKAVRAFQQRRGVLADGVVGPHTWSELVEAGWRLGDRILYLRNPYLRGDDVMTLQARLNALGFDAGREDGIFGRDSAQAVRAFQREYDIAEDGIFGPKSHAALIGLRIDRPGTAAPLREELKRLERAGIREALIVIDPGHGGDDPGDPMPGGACEAELCWDIARALADRLLGAGARVRLTRTETEGPELPERAALANEVGAELFLSLHLNSHDEPAAQGASVYYFAGSRAGELLAERVQEQLVSLGLGNCRTHARAYPVLKETRMPAVLIEPAFVTSPDDQRRLIDPLFRAAIADAITIGVHRYFEQGA